MPEDHEAYEKMQAEIIQLKERLESLEEAMDEMYTEEEVRHIMHRACEDGARGYEPEELRLHDYI